MKRSKVYLGALVTGIGFVSLINFPMSGQVTLQAGPVSEDVPNYHIPSFTVKETKIWHKAANLWVKDLETISLKQVDEKKSFGAANAKAASLQADYNALYAALNLSGTSFNEETVSLYVLDARNEFSALKPHDRITQIDKVDVSTFDTLDQLKESLPPFKNREVVFTVQRDGETTVIGVNANETDGDLDLFLERKITSEGVSDFPTDRKAGGNSSGLAKALYYYNSVNGINLEELGLEIAATGSVSKDGKIGPVSGLRQKLIGLSEKQIDLFFVPKANEQQIRRLMRDLHLSLKLVPVETLDEAVKALTKEINK